MLPISAQNIADHITSFYRHRGYQADQVSQALIDHVLFVTMKFDNVELAGSQSDPAAYLNKFHIWYRTIMMMSFGKHFGRPTKRRLQPLTYAFVDFPGSRTRRSPKAIAKDQASFESGRGLYDQTRHNNSLEYLNSGLLHVHAVMALTPGLGEACRIPVFTSGLTQQSRSSHGIDVCPFDPAKASLDRLIAYAMKGAVQIGQLSDGECYDVFPRFNRSERTPARPGFDEIRK